MAEEALVQRAREGQKPRLCIWLQLEKAAAQDGRLECDPAVSRLAERPPVGRWTVEQRCRSPAGCEPGPVKLDSTGRGEAPTASTGKITLIRIREFGE